MAKKKVLLMGKAHSGKTSMRSIIFANYLARDTTRLSPTLDVEHHHVRFLGDLVLNLWDCGGQDAFYESYFERDRETIFRSVELLIYVFDIESDCPEKDFDHFAGVLEAIEENSPDARIFVLVHKMDLVAEEDRMEILEDRKLLIEESCLACGVTNFQCFGTSIWDETLYKAWSEIVTNLIPNIGLLESHLNNFCRICDADEVVLFERATFLVISHAQSSDNTTNNVVANKSSGTNLIDNGGAARGTSGASEQPTLEQQVAVGKAEQQQGGGDDTASPGTIALDTTTNDGSEHGIGADVTAAVDETSDRSPSIASSPKQNSIDGSGDNASAAERDANNNLVDNLDDHGGEQQQQEQHQIQTQKQQAQKSSPSQQHYFDAHRFEKISNIVKQFKLSCGKAQSQFQGMEVRNSKFSAFIDAFTVNTYIMVIVSLPKNVHTATTLLNIKNAKPHFERLIPRV